MPRLVERIRASAAASPANTAAHHINNSNPDMGIHQAPPASSNNDAGVAQVIPSYTPENSSTAASSDSFGAQVSPVSDLTTDYYTFQANNNNKNNDNFQAAQVSYPDCLTSPIGYLNHGLDFQAIEQSNVWLGGGDVSENLWNVEDSWFL